MTKSDKQYIDGKFKEFIEKFRQNDQKFDQILTLLSNQAGAIGKMQEDLEVLAYHSTENFDTNERQDKRLDRLEHKVGLPALAI